MNKLQLLRITNAALLASVLVQAATGLILLFEIKVPNINTVLVIHGRNGLILTALVIVHIMLNWGWIKTNFIKK